MNSSSISDFVPSVLTLIQKIKISDDVKSNSEQLNKITAAEQIISTISEGLIIRDGMKLYSKFIDPTHQDPDNPKVIIFNRHPFPFESIRIGVVSGIISTTWGIYDNIAQACKLLLDVDQNGKIPNNLMGILDCEFGLLPIPGNIFGPIRQKYRYPVALSYQIRNSTLHRLPYICGSHRSFISDLVDDGFIVKGENYRDLLRFCQIRHGIKSNEITKFGLITGSDQCLLEVIDRLETPTDECAIELLKISLKPHIPDHFS